MSKLFTRREGSGVAVHLSLGQRLDIKAIRFDRRFCKWINSLCDFTPYWQQCLYVWRTEWMLLDPHQWNSYFGEIGVSCQHAPICAQVLKKLDRHSMLTRGSRSWKDPWRWLDIHPLSRLPKEVHHRRWKEHQRWSLAGLGSVLGLSGRSHCSVGPRECEPEGCISARNSEEWGDGTRIWKSMLRFVLRQSLLDTGF